MLERIIDILGIPIIILNFTAGIVGGIWLAILGEWGLIGIGILFLLTSSLILSVLMIPNMLIGGLVLHINEKKKVLKYGIGFIAQFYSNLLVVATCVFAFFVCSHFYNDNIGLGYMPYLLWSWSMALGPWFYMVSKEPDNEFAAITLFSASLFYFLFLTSIFISSILSMVIVIIFGIVQLVVVPIFNMYLVYQSEEGRGEY